jgi:hypothetical protein
VRLLKAFDAASLRAHQEFELARGRRHGEKSRGNQMRVNVLATPEARELRISINRSTVDTYEFLSVPENFARWMWGPGITLRKADSDWIAETAQGPVTFCLTDHNSFGVVDFALTRQVGHSIYVPLRIVATTVGCDLVLTLFHYKHISDEKLARTAEQAMADLKAAKRILEVVD